MAIHDDVLEAARQRCAANGTWQFVLSDVVASLPHLNESSVRTHVTSRCCTNAPKNHAHRWPYFRRLSRGVYEVMPKYRTAGTTITTGALRDALHVTVSRNEGKYTAECLELPVITEARDMNELMRNLREAILLHLEDENRATLGLAPGLRLVITAELPLAASA
jgi:predicted RNase H-like HicB family nuclease